MNGLWQQLLLTGGVWVVIGIVLTAIFARAKTGAETDEIVEKTRSAVLKDLRSELEGAREDRRTIRAELNAELALSEERRKLVLAMQLKMDRQMRLIQSHTEWDRLVLIALSEHEIVGIPDPPELEHD